MQKSQSTLSEPQHHVAQNHALDVYTKELERIVSSSKFLTQCHSNKIIRQSDKENITKHRNPTEKAKIFTNRIKDLPRLFVPFITLLKKDPKNRLLATSIEDAKTSKEHEMKIQQDKIKAHKGLAFEVGKRFSTIVTGVESELCLENLPLAQIVTELSKLVDQVEIFKRKFNPDHNATIFSLLQIEEQRKHRENFRVLEMQIENDKLQKEIECLKREILHEQDMVERQKSEVLNRENWIKGLETSLENATKKVKEFEKKAKWCNCNGSGDKSSNQKTESSYSTSYAPAKGRMSSNSDRQLHLINDDFEQNNPYDDPPIGDENNNKTYEDEESDEISTDIPYDDDQLSQDLSNDELDNSESPTFLDDNEQNFDVDIDINPLEPPTFIITQHWSRQDTAKTYTNQSLDTSIMESEILDMNNTDSEGYSSPATSDSSGQSNMMISKVIIKKYKRSMTPYYKQ